MLRQAMVLCVSLTACEAAHDGVGGDEAGGADHGGGGSVSASGGAGAGGGAGGEPACSKNVVPLELTISRDGVADSQVIPVRYQGEDAYLAIDTGSPYTFVFGPEGAPEYIEHFGDVEIGCETFPVDQITLEALEPESFNGKLIVGIVGMNFFSEVPTEIDYPGRVVARYLQEDPSPTGLTEVPAEWTDGRILVEAALDDQPVRLMYDAGSPHTLWVGQEPEPGDVEISLGTANGEATTVYEGTAMLDFADDTDLSIPVWRAPSFPYLEAELVEKDADGLLGATGLGFRRVVFDLQNDTMWLGPRVEP